MHRIFLSTATLIVLTETLAFAAIKDPVHLDRGLISGAPGSTTDVRIYKGIPFAAAPIGNLRWRAPQPAARWSGVRAADHFGPVCMQNVPGGPAGQQASEDCLYLNVWTAAKSASERRPVMVWIYGGGYYVGSGSQPQYDGEALARKGAVVVTFNYRLGEFGFFSYPELTKESDGRGAANFGLMDAIAALQWVQKNIAAFGGDPKRVTIFGESAGGGLVANLMASPRAKGLFQRAIGESSSWSTVTIGRLSTLSEAEQAGVKLADGLGAKSLADLRALPAGQILKAGRGLGPVVDGWWIPEDPGIIFAQGKQNAVPVLAGSNRDESFAREPATAEQFLEQSRLRFGDLADKFVKLYPADSGVQAKESAFTAGRDEVAWVMQNWARMEEKTGKSKAYVYFFTHQPPVQRNSGKGGFAPNTHGSAVHTSEIQYVFDNLRGSRAWTDVDRQIAEEMSSYWVNFAANGDPNGKGLPEWPAYNGQEKTTMVFGNKPEPGSALSEAKLSFFQAYFQKLYQ